MNQTIASELAIRTEQVAAVVRLLDEGATIPFIARYRKEATGSLDDTQLRTLEERLHYLRELEQRRKVILEEIHTQGKLDDELRARIMATTEKARLEDIYLPYRPKRRTKAQIAKEAGLQPLAEGILNDPSQDPRTVAATYVNPDQGITDVESALESARAILIEHFAEDADLIGDLRERMWSQGWITAKVRAGKETEGAKFADYFDFAEPLTKLPSHRVLALFRGEKEEVLDLTVTPAEPDTEDPDYQARIAERFDLHDQGRAADAWLHDTVRRTWRTKILLRLSIDVRTRLRQAAEDEAVRVFTTNLRDLLLAAPAGTRTTIGLDPGYRAGVKVAVVDSTGQLVASDTVYPHKPQARWDDALDTLSTLAQQHNVQLLAIGNGTASRETDKLAGELVALRPELQLAKVTVSEAGASVYSATEYAARELPDVDVSLRGAVSIARRLQDPLAELVKIDPKSIGVGQYQHDVSQTKLSRSLDGVVEDCVNAVGVDVNTASAPLLGRVSGIGPGLAENIVTHRNTHGPFRSRAALHEVHRLGPKAFEQCAGFLRILEGDNPLDASSVHPEAYPVVRRILEHTGTGITELVGSTQTLRELSPEQFQDEEFGLPTVQDILGELEKPGRDPRPEFRTATFAEGVETMDDLEPGMRLEGVVTNVAAFGAFVDIGVQQDGLVHISAMSRDFVENPRQVVKPGDVVSVKVLHLDRERKRIGLTLRLDEESTTQKSDAPGKNSAKNRAQQGNRGRQGQAKQKQQHRGRPDRSGKRNQNEGAMAEALRQAGYRR